MRPRLVLVRSVPGVHAVLAAALVASGCTGGGSADEPTPEPANLRDGLAALYAGDHPTDADRATAACFADALVERTGVEELREAGLVGTDGAVVSDAPTLPPAMATQWVRAQATCVDSYDELARAQVDATKGRTDAGQYAACLRRAISAAELEAAFVAALTGALDDPAVARLSGVQQQCS